jgi:hypothetical protein
VTLEMEHAESHAGIMLWGGELGMELNWQKLAELWREKSRDLPHLRTLLDETSLPDGLYGNEGVDAHFQEYAGKVGNVPTHTWVGYLVQGSRSFVLMGIFPEGDVEARELVQEVIGRIRFSPPEPNTTEERPAEAPPVDEAPGPAPESPKPPAATPPVKAEPPSPLKNVRLLDGEQEVEGPVSRDIRRLTCRADVDGLAPDSLVRAEWYFLDGDNGGHPFVTDEQRFREGETQMRFDLLRPDNSLFPSGSYRVLLLVGEAVASADFLLRDPTEPELLAKAREGIAEGQFGLYAYLEMGKLQQVTEREALDWLQKAAHQGMSIAQYQWGLVLFEGRHGVAEDKVAAMDWFRRAALQQNADAAHYLARGYREGLGVPRSLVETLAWTRRAAKLGKPESQYNLGLHYLLGQGVSQDSKRALDWFRQSADAGYEPARETLRQLESPQEKKD